MNKNDEDAELERSVLEKKRIICKNQENQEKVIKKIVNDILMGTAATAFISPLFQYTRKVLCVGTEGVIASIITSDQHRTEDSTVIRHPKEIISLVFNHCVKCLYST